MDELQQEHICSHRICVHCPCNVIWGITLCRHTRRATVEEVRCDLHRQLWQLLPVNKNKNSPWLSQCATCVISYFDQEVLTLWSFLFKEVTPWGFTPVALRKQHHGVWDQIKIESDELSSTFFSLTLRRICYKMIQRDKRWKVNGCRCTEPSTGANSLSRARNPPREPKQRCTWGLHFIHNFHYLFCTWFTINTPHC